MSSFSTKATSPKSGTRDFRQPHDKDKIEGQPLPSNQDAEQGLLAACIVDSSGEVISACIEKSLRIEDFYFLKHQLIYEAIIGLHNNTVEIDEIVLIEKLQSDGQLEQVGGKDGVMFCLRESILLHMHRFGSIS